MRPARINLIALAAAMRSKRGLMSDKQPWNDRPPASACPSSPTFHLARSNTPTLHLSCRHICLCLCAIAASSGCLLCITTASQLHLRAFTLIQTLIRTDLSASLAVLRSAFCTRTGWLGEGRHTRGVVALVLAGKSARFVAGLGSCRCDDPFFAWRETSIASIRAKISLCLSVFENEEAPLSSHIAETAGRIAADQASSFVPLVSLTSTFL